MENKDLDRMMEDFLSDNRVEDREFSENVMASLPQQPRLVWITQMYPVLGILAAMFIVWKFDVLNPKTLMSYVSQAMLLWNTHVGFSATISVGMVLAVLAVVGFFVSEKVKDW